VTSNILIKVSEAKEYDVAVSAVQNIGEFVCDRLGISSLELSVNFVSADEIKRLNREFRAKDQSTDVLSFPLMEWAEAVTLETPYKNPSSDIPRLLGDIVISLDNVRRNANAIGHSLDRECCFMLVHGILHLVGHNHLEKDEERLMLDQQKKLIDALSDSGAEIWKGCVTLLTDTEDKSKFR